MSLCSLFIIVLCQLLIFSYGMKKCFLYDIWYFLKWNFVFIFSLPVIFFDFFFSFKISYVILYVLTYRLYRLKHLRLNCRTPSKLQFTLLKIGECILALLINTQLVHYSLSFHSHLRRNAMGVGLVFSADLATAEHTSHWVLQGVSLCLNVDT